MKLKKFLILFLFSLIIFSSCQRDEFITNPPFTSQGVYVLYEGSFGMPSSYDFAFIDLNTDSVKSNVFRNSNSGASLAPFPDGMVILDNNELYITSQGNFGGQGKIQKIITNDNRITDTLSFGTNPYNLTSYLNNFYVTNIGGSNVTKLNRNLDIQYTYGVGPNPKDPMFAIGGIYITKAAYTTEYSLAIINIYTDQVTKAFFPAPPVSAANTAGGVYVSTYSHKKLYIMDSLIANLKIDSVPINIPEPAIGDIMAGDRSIYIVAIADTNFGGYTGKKLYRYDVATRQIDPNFNVTMTGINDIYGIAYEYVSQRIYIANAKGFTASGEVLLYDRFGNLLKTYNIGGFAPKRFAFKYN